MKIRDFTQRTTESLLVVPLGVLAFAVCGVIAAAVATLFVWDGAFNPVSHVSFRLVARSLPDVVGTVMPAAALGTTLLLIFRIRKRPGFRTISLLLGAGTAAALLFFGSVSWERLHPGSERLPAITVQPFVQGHMHLLASGALYVGSVDGERLRDLVVVRPDQSPAFTYSALGRLRPARELVSYSGGTISVSPPNPYFTPIFEPPAFLANLLSDIGALDSALAAARAASKRDFAVTIGAIVLLGMGGILFARMSSWPLLNAFLALLAYRGFLWGYPWLSRDPVTALQHQIASALRLGEISRLLPSFEVTLLGVLLIAIDLLFMNRRSKATEAHPDE